MAKIEKSEESGPQLFFDFTWNYVPQLFLGPPRAEKMTFSQKTGHVWFGDTYFLNPWCLPVNLPYWAPLGTSLKLFCSSRPMWPATAWGKNCFLSLNYFPLDQTSHRPHWHHWFWTLDMNNQYKSLWVSICPFNRSFWQTRAKSQSKPKPNKKKGKRNFSLRAVAKLLWAPTFHP